MKNATKSKFSNSQNVLGRQNQGLAVGTIALAIVLVLVASYGIIQMTEKQTHSASEKLVSEVVEHIDAKLAEVREVTREEAKMASEILDYPIALEQLPRKFVQNNAFVYGSTVAFEPNYFPGLGRCYAPYSWKTSDGEVHSRQLGTETDYYQEEWYAETKRTRQEYWCEPYFDEGGAKIMMCTFSVPLMNDSGELAAILTADVGLDDLEEYVSSISPTPDSYIILRSKNGIILANADLESKINSDSIIIKGLTEIGWSVELVVPFNYLMHGSSGTFFFIGTILFITLIFVYFFNRFLSRMKQRSSEEYKNVIDAISSSFSSIYLIKLDSKDAYIFRNPEKYEKVVQIKDHEVSDYTLMLDDYIEYDCYEPDRSLMHHEILPETICESLKEQDRYEVRFRKSVNGEPRWFEMHVFAVDRDKEGTAQRAVMAFADVNDSILKEKLAQETLEKALVDAQAASKAKTDFLFNMSHDIRTPMNAIIGFTNMAKKHIDDNEKVLDCLDKTQQSGNLLLALINSVLDVSRIESGQAKIEESAANVAYSFTAIEDTLSELAEARDIDISFEIGDIWDKYVYCDLDRCNRIFVNIISNSIKYTPEGGWIKIRCDQMESTREGYGNYRYVFEDNGIGMSEEFQKNVFDQFTREKTSTVSGIQGSGLGLAVCKSFVDLMGGTIECRSKQNEGTVFTVILPFRIQEGKTYVDPFTRNMVDASEEVSKDNPVVLKGKRVLLVEDNELNMEIAVDILEDAGLIVETASDGSVAVEILKEKGPDYYDFILMDIQMPMMNGYEATKAIRAMYPDSGLPIIAVSANAFDEDRKASRDAGMDEHVAKPINVSDLLHVMSKF